MTVELLFSICNLIVVPQWLLLLVAPGWKGTQQLAASYLIPVLLALVYVLLLIMHYSETQNGGFGSLVAVRVFFSSDNILLAGWIHITIVFVCMALMPFDHRLVMNVDPWIKPAKFAISIAVFAWSMG